MTKTIEPTPVDQVLPKLTRLHDAVVALAQEHPDRVYQCKPGTRICSYHPDELNPDGCIIGAALRSLGADLFDRYTYPGEPGAVVPMAGPAGGIIQKSYLGGPCPSQYQRHLEWFREVQLRQDRGMTWGRAVSTADTEMAAANPNLWDTEG